RRNVVVGQQYGVLRVVENDQVRKEDRVSIADRVILDGVLRVRPGVEVNPKPAASPSAPWLAAPRTLFEAPPPHALKPTADTRADAGGGR
ncbi:MAG: hypothetical protein K2V38_16245, partial [Gemmataceae bacterium]|nr:hypothetical protein [Gemmataceae bacterium]